MEKKVLAALEKAAEDIEVNEDSPIALDWINGRRTPDADQSLKGALSGLSLGTDAPSIMRMLLESTAFGARAILECFEKGGVEVGQIIAVTESAWVTRTVSCSMIGPSSRSSVT